MIIKDPPVQITDRMWMLGTNPFPVFLYRGGEASTIFEGAVNAMGPIVRQQLETLKVGHDTVQQAVITHAHPDHVMAIPTFREMFPNLAVIASPPAAKTLQVEKAVAFFGKIDGALTEWLVELQLLDPALRPSPQTEKQIDVDRTVGDGDSLDVGDGIAFRVLATPGHSHCSLSFHEPDENVLVVADATGYFLPDQDFLWPCYFTSYRDYLDSIRRLADIGAEVLCLGHNAVIQGTDDVAAYFRRAVADTEKYHEHIVGQVKSGVSVETIAQELGSDVYERTRQLTLDFFEKNCALLVKHSLQHEGIEGES